MTPDRTTYIGSTEAAAALGVSEYRTALDVYLQKKGLAPPRETTEAMEAGIILEPAIIEIYRRRAGCDVLYPSTLHRHPDHPFIGATPDALGGEHTVRDAVWTARHCVDAKASNWRRAHDWGEPGTDEVPLDYLVQAQQHMLCTGLPRCDLVVMFDPTTVRIYTVHAHDVLQSQMVAAECRLWEQIMRGTPPEPQYDRPGCLSAVKRLYDAVEPGETVALADDAAVLWTAYRETKDQMADLETQAATLEARLRVALGTAAVGRLPDGREITRIKVKGSVWTAEDAAEVAAKIGQVKRKPYDYLRERKVK